MSLPPRLCLCPVSFGCLCLLFLFFFIARKQISFSVLQSSKSSFVCLLLFRYFLVNCFLCVYFPFHLKFYVQICISSSVILSFSFSPIFSSFRIVCILSLRLKLFKKNLCFTFIYLFMYVKKFDYFSFSFSVSL